MKRISWVLLLLLIFLVGCEANRSQTVAEPIATSMKTDWRKDLTGTWICENRLPRDRMIFIDDTLRYVRDGKIQYEGPYRLDDETTQIILPAGEGIWSFDSLVDQGGKLIAFTPGQEDMPHTWIYGKEH